MRNLFRSLCMLSLLTALIHFASCNRITPAGFWSNYHHKYLQENIQNQGPWGETSLYCWNYQKNSKEFNQKQMLHFAQENDWSLVDSMKVFNDSIYCRSNANRLDYSHSILSTHLIPLLKQNNEYTIFVFKTRWVAVKPGNSDETEKNGFIIFDKKNSIILAFHKWGE